jgi:hypothetical protein
MLTKVTLFAIPIHVSIAVAVSPRYIGPSTEFAGASYGREQIVRQVAMHGSMVYGD